ncbi:MAG: 4Fe-4S binding protein [Saprospiraceae bacterium]
MPVINGWAVNLVKWESVYGEGIGIRAFDVPAAATNAFGRRIITGDASPLEFAAGLSLSGIRSAAFISGAACLQAMPVLEGIARYQSPVVVYVYKASIDRLLPLLDRLPCLILSAGSPQEALDMALIARRVAEFALLPAIVLLEGSDREAPAPVFPFDAGALAYLGNPDERIDSPTPAQEIVFGRQRRRVPRWFDHELPVLLGPVKSADDQVIETLAQRKFFDAHLEEVLLHARNDFQRIFGRPAECFKWQGPEQAEACLIANGHDPEVLQPALKAYLEKGKQKMGLLQLTQCRPFPGAAIRPVLKTMKKIAVVAPPGTVFHQWLGSAFSVRPEFEWCFGLHTGELTTEDVDAVFSNMGKGGGQLRDFVLGTPFTREKSLLPRYEVLLQEIKRAYPDLSTSVLATYEPGNTAWIPSSQLPQAVRRLKDAGPPYARLSHFAQHTAYLYRSGELAEKIADPFKALPLMPAASAGLLQAGKSRETIPCLTPDKCTACGICSVSCPHAALPALLINWETILRGGMDISAKQGRTLGLLTPLVKNLGKKMGQLTRAIDGRAVDLSEFLQAAFAEMADQSAWDREKRILVQNDINTLGSVLKYWQPIVHEGFFREQETMEQCSGGLFALFTDPYACTGCGICASACPEGALEMSAPSDEILQRERARFELWEEMPDTPLSAIDAAVGKGAANPLSALYWNRERFRSMVGGALDERGAGAKVLLHALQTVVLHDRRINLGLQEQRIQALIDQLSARIHTAMSDALPKKTFQEISTALERFHGDKLYLDILLSGLGEASHLRKVDAAAMRRQLELLGQLQDLYGLLREGPTGVGRATFGVIIGGEYPAWLGAYPYNHFNVPALLCPPGALHDWSSGLMYGGLRHSLDNLRLLRRAAQELKGGYRPGKNDEALANLTWEDLSAEEKQLVPPLLVLSFGEVAPVPGSRLQPLPFIPILVSRGGAAGYGEVVGRATDSGYPVVQSSLAVPGHFAASVKSVLSRQPGLLHVLAPEAPGMDIFSASQLALATRAFPLLAFHPGVEAEDCLAGNPAPGADWADGEKAWPAASQLVGPYRLTFADWFCQLPEGQPHFEPWEPTDGMPVPLGTYLEMNEGLQHGKVPVVMKALPVSGEGQLLKVAPYAVSLSRSALRQWKSLQWISGKTQLLQRKAWEQRETALEERHRAALLQLEGAFADRLQKAAEQWKIQARDKLRDQLVRLSKTKQ